MRKSVILGATALVGAMYANPAFAQGVDEQPDEARDQTRQTGGILSGEIVVTAQKRSQNMQSVGISVTALNSEQLTTLGLKDSIDIAKMSSNVSLSGSYAGQMSQFSIRGVTQNDPNDHVESVVAIYVDDAYVSMQQGQAFGMFDLERVEVLKGPQGTLFGRNATGGLIHFITKRPTDYFAGYLDATYGSYDNVRLEGALSGPLTDGLRARLSGMFERWDGYIYNKYPEETFVPTELQGDLNSVTLPGAGSDLGGMKYNWALRGQVEADVTDEVMLWLSGFYNKSRASTGQYQQLPAIAELDANGVQINTYYAGPNEVCETLQVGQCVNGLFDSDANAVRERPGADWFGYLDPDGRGRTTSMDYAFDDVNVFETYGFTGRLEADLGFADLTLISDYKNFFKDFSLDLEDGPANQFVWHAVADAESFSQEVRLNGSSDRLDWVAGGYFLYIDNTSVHGIAALPDSVFPIPSWDQPRIANLTSKSYSLFGQLEYQVTDQLSVIGGLRGSREKKDYNFEVLFVSPTDGGDPYGWDYAPALDIPGFSQGLYENKSSETLWSWKAQVNYEPFDRGLLYLGITQGAKAGSYNAGGPPLAEADIPYDAEKLISYEGGIKATLGGGIRVNASAYYYDYQNYQASRWQGTSAIIINADAYVYGGELEVAGALTDNLEFLFNAGYQKNKVKDVPVAGELRDVEITFAPRWTLSSMLRYTVPVDIAGGKVAFQVDGTYQSKVWHNLNNFDANKLNGWGVVNGRIDWASINDRVTLALFGKNLFDKKYDTVGFDLAQVCGCNLLAQGKPRWFGVQARLEM